MGGRDGHRQLLFEAIPHDKLMQAVEERVSDQAVLKLLRAMLRAGVMAGRAGAARGDRHSAGRGDLAVAGNVYLHRLDRAWDVREHGVLVRYADDLVVMCRSREQAEAALARLAGPAGRARVWNRRRPRPGSCTWRRVARDSTSSASTIGWCARRGAPAARRVTFLARWPSSKAMQHARDRIRELTRPVPAAAAGRVRSWRTSTGSCAAGPRTSGTATRRRRVRQDQGLCA